MAKNWTTATGVEILADVQLMKVASIAAKHFGPWVLYVPTNFETRLDNDFKDASDKSTRSRILEINGVTEIKVSDTLTSSNVLLVQMTSDVIRVVEGMAMQTLEWSAEGGMVHNFKVMAIMVPQIRADQYGNSGIVHLKA